MFKLISNTDDLQFERELNAFTESPEYRIINVQFTTSGLNNDYLEAALNSALIEYEWIERGES